jgi:hypothetical protein
MKQEMLPCGSNLPQHSNSVRSSAFARSSTFARRERVFDEDFRYYRNDAAIRHA